MSPPVGEGEPESLHGDAELDALVERDQATAAHLASETVLALRARGYDLVLVRISKVITHGGRCATAGATAYECVDRLLPALPREADGLRRIGDELDEMFREGGTYEAERGYEEDVLHREGFGGSG